MKKIVLGIIGTLVLSSTVFSQDDMSWMYEDKSVDEVKETKIINANCPRPIKLKFINDNQDVHRYNDELHKYTSCINNFNRGQYNLLNTTKDPQKRLVYIASINKAKSDLKSYDRVDDVEQNQHHQSTIELDGLGYERDH